MKREHRLRYIIKEGLLDTFYIWKDEFDSNPDISNLKNLISRLRSKIPALKIENIYGFGYKIVTI